MSSQNIEAILNSLTEQDKVLIVCNYQLYDGDWQALLNDLQARLEGRPYVLKLGERIKEDIQRVHRLMEIEKENNIKLGDFVKV